MQVISPDLALDPLITDFIKPAVKLKAVTILLVAGLYILTLLLRNVDVKPYLRSLLKHRDADGYTPFMYAVRNRAYPAAFAIYDCESEFLLDTTR